MAEQEPLLTVEDMHIRFEGRRKLGGNRTVVRAVDGVSFHINPGETLSLVGESGCGKSTTARGLMRLVKPKQGRVTLDGKELLSLSERELRSERSKIQMVFQDPYSSLDPSMLVGGSISEPLDTHTKMSRSEKIDRVAEVLKLVGLPTDYMNRYPHEFSGGQRQRITIARAIAAQPKMLILDEAVSALDVSTQNQVLELLEDLQQKLGLAYLFIAHDLSVVRHISDRVAVMYLGRIVEEGEVERVYDNPVHPYTRSLLGAAPVPSPRTQRARERILLQGDPPDPTREWKGCRFASRCAFVMEKCHTIDPATLAVPGGGTAACHLMSEPSADKELVG